MNRILRELSSIPGMVLSMTVVLIITFWVLNATRRYGPSVPVVGSYVGNAADFAGRYATGQPYGF